MGADWALLGRLGLIVLAVAMVFGGLVAGSVVALDSGGIPERVRPVLLVAAAALIVGGVLLLCGPGPALR